MICRPDRILRRPSQHSAFDGTPPLTLSDGVIRTFVGTYISLFLSLDSELNGPQYTRPIDRVLVDNTPYVLKKKKKIVSNHKRGALLP